MRQSHSLFIGYLTKFQNKILVIYCELFTNYYGETGGFRMEKYTELEVLINKAKSGDKGAIEALNEVMEQLNQFQS